MALSSLRSSSNSSNPFSSLTIQGQRPSSAGGAAPRVSVASIESDDAVSVQLSSRVPVPEVAASYARRPSVRPEPTPEAVEAAANSTEAKPIADPTISVSGLFGKDGTVTLDSGVTGKFEEVGNDQVSFSVGGYDGIIDRQSGRGIAKDANGNEITFDFSQGKDGVFKAENFKALEKSNKPDSGVAFAGTFDEKGFTINGTQGSYAQQANGNIAFEIGGFRGQVDTSGRGTAFDKDGNVFQFQASYDGKNGFSITQLSGGR